MVVRIFSWICAFLVLSQGAQGFAESPAAGLYSISVRTIEGKEALLETYRGKVLLIVNTASRCGFTPQYEALEEIYRRYKDRGFEILAFPSNDFMGQEPGSDAEIKEFCKTTYDVTFPLFARGPVTGEEKQPVFKFLTEQSAEELRGEVRWNFEKFLLSRQGVLVERFRSFTSPSSERVTTVLEKLLAEN